MSQCKIDMSFPIKEFDIVIYNIFQKNRNKNGGGLMYDFNQVWNSKLNIYSFSQGIVAILFEHFPSRNWTDSFWIEFKVCWVGKINLNFFKIKLVPWIYALGAT